jgi:hypothetical protein|nr:MAG TPA: endonuclease [Caudoviricetes sp.]
MNKFKSFYDWCTENNHSDYLDRWDVKLNEKSPKDVPHQSNLKYYFKCLDHPEHASELKRLDNIVHQPKSILCKQCNSFGQYLLDNRLMHLWDNKRNECSPYKITKQCSNKKVWIKCDKTTYHGSYQIKPSHFYEGNRCPYCTRHSGLVHKYDSLGYNYPVAASMWSDKNNKSSYEYAPNSQKKVWWKCPEGKHKDFCKEIFIMTRDNFHCPKCSEEMKNSYLQEKVYSYFTKKGYNVLTERDCNILPRSPKNNRPLPYDNEITDLNLICEIHGKQHYWKECSWYKHLAKRNNITPEEEFNIRKEYDKYKMDYALNHGYNYLIIPYWSEKDDQYKTLIDTKINEIIKSKCA